jgi:multidrug resistance protein, MATE family
MAASLLIVIVRRERNRRPGLMETPLSIEAGRLRQLVALGAPAAGQLTLEVGVFAMASALASRLAPAGLAAHQIVLNLAGLTFMVPLGVSAAAAVRVGRAIGARRPEAAQHAGWVAIGAVVAVMCCSALVFLFAPRVLLNLFTRDVAVVATGVSLLGVAAMFQIFDGLQVVATGVLRGIGDTHTAAVWNLIGHWGVGLPLGWWLCFHGGWGVAGLWVGLSTGLIIVALVLVRTWAIRQRRLDSLATRRKYGAANRPMIAAVP